MKRKIKKIALLLISVLMAMVIPVACTETQAKGIATIDKTGSEGLVDYYTITYTDGTTSIFTVTNGDDLDVAELFASYLEQYPDATYEQFLDAVLSVSVDETTTAINRALQSSLQVYTEFTERYRSPFGTVVDTALYMGSAVIYSIEDDYTYLITNYHVIYDVNAGSTDKLAERIVCYMYGSEGEPYATDEINQKGGTVYDYGDYAIECEYVGGSATADLAVIRTRTAAIKAINPNIAQIEFADGYSVGQTAIAIGNPNGEGISVTKGIVSVDNEFIQLSVDGTTRDYRSIRIDTALYGGNSGGGLFDVNGELIGITNAGNNEDQNINYAIPLNIVKSTVESIMYYGEQGEQSVKKLSVGISVRYENSRYIYDAQSQSGKIREDVIVNEVSSNSLAAQFGIKVDDIITAIVVNDAVHEIDRYFDIGDILYTVRMNDEISFSLIRDGNAMQTPVYTVTASDLVTVA